MINDRNPAFLFDLDGVLIDSKEWHWSAWEKLKKELPAIQSMDYAEFEKGFGKSNEAILRSYLPSTDKEERLKWGERKEELFREECAGKVQLLPGMELFLKEIEAYPKIIASSTPLTNLRFFLKATILGKFFQKFISGEEVENGKPAPDIFIEAAKRLSVPVQQSIVLEDSLAGLKAGRDAGAFVVALATTIPYAELEKMDVYDALFKSPQDLTLSSILKSSTSK